jgi:hypothetical protein
MLVGVDNISKLNLRFFSRKMCVSSSKTLKNTLDGLHLHIFALTPIGIHLSDTKLVASAMLKPFMIKYN